MQLMGSPGIIISLLVFIPGSSENPEQLERAAAIEYNKNVLRSAGFEPDDPGLIRYFKSRILYPEQQEQVKKAIQDLGDESYETREKASEILIKSGKLSLPFLRPVLKDQDPERVQRAKLAVETIEKNPDLGQLLAAAELASQRRPTGITDAILECLPWIEEDQGKEKLINTLVVTGMENGKASDSVIKAAKHRHSICRGAAAYVLGHGDPGNQKIARDLLEDPDVLVRHFASKSLIQSGDIRAVPVLLELISEGPLQLAWQSDDLLCRIAGDKIPTVSAGNWDEAGRLRYRQAWEEWWKINQSNLVIKQNLLKSDLLGFNLVIELDGGSQEGRIWECDSHGKERWNTLKINRPIDAQILSGGRILVAEHGQSRVTERDQNGEILWEFKVSSQPVAVKRLPNGNTFIVTYQEIMEVTRDGKIMYSLKKPTMIYFGTKLRNNMILYINNTNQIVEVDETGKEHKSITIGKEVGLTGGWASVEKLVNGRYLVSLYGSRKVVEIEEDGKVVWEVIVDSPGYASRLPSGNTLIASIEGHKIVEVNRSGKVVWEQPTRGRPFHVYRR